MSITDTILNKFASAPAGYFKTQEFRQLAEKARAMIAEKEPQNLNKWDAEITIMTVK
jgi:hypothetical protein